jgi:hypothetical protein
MKNLCTQECYFSAYLNRKSTRGLQSSANCMMEGKVTFITEGLVLFVYRTTVVIRLSSTLCCQGLKPRGPFWSQYNNLEVSLMVSWVPPSCWLVYHNSIWESSSVHSVNVYPFMFVIVDFFQDWLCFVLFLKNCFFATVILGLSGFCNVQVSLSYSRASFASMLYTINLVCFC